MLMGPYSTNLVDVYITKVAPGVYVLSRDGKVAHYVGRSDIDVGARVKQSSSEKAGYTHFWFEYAPSPKEAYDMECELYHKYSPPDNINHPAAPLGTNWRCPIAGCIWL